MHEYMAYLLLSLDKFLAPKGFTLLPQKQQFRKALGQGSFQNIVVSLSAYPDTVLISFHLGSRLAAVESLIQQFTQHLPDFKAEANTVLTEQGRLLGQPYLRHKAKDLAQLQEISLDFQDFMDKKGFAFLAQCTTLDSLEALINTQAEQPHPYFYNAYYRAIKGLVLARLAFRPDFEDLYQAYATQLQKLHSPAFQSENLEKLARFLRFFSFN
ncbi:MAG: hypothetical protein HC913_08155 [Microscillaceae bacterium]|nr:hypothetical protein [Microscillaceae bacterium]